MHRAKGEGCIAKRNDGRYQSSIQIDGVRKTFYGRTEREVLDKLKMFQAHNLVGMKEDCDYTFDEYVNYWLYNVKRISLKPGSYDRLEKVYELYLKDLIGKKKLRSLTTKELQRIINDYTSRYAYNTITKIYRLIKACLTYAVKVRDLSYNPMDAVEMPRESACAKRTKEICIPSDNDMERFFKEGRKQYGTNKYVYTQNYVDAYELIANTGLRVGEALALKNDDIDQDRGELKVNGTVSEIINRDGSEKHYKRIITDPKTNSGKRVLVLNKAALGAIKRIQERNKDIPGAGEYLILNTKGELATYHDLQRTMKKIYEKAGIRPFGIHTLRHYFASRFLGCGGGAFILSKYLGHSSPSITLKIYAHMTQAHEAELKRIINCL